jgi:hypothetical protein
MTSEMLATKKLELRKFELQFNVARLETRLLEMDEEKSKIQESIDAQKAELNKY